MKTNQQSPAVNLSLRFDSLLKTILITDIKSFKEKAGIVTSNHQATDNQALAAA